MVRTTIASGSQTIINDKKYTVKDGTYAVHHRTVLRTDLLYQFAMKDTDYKGVWNIFYTRWHHAISKQEIVKDIFILGTGVNFFKRNGTLSGGFYIQSSDLFNNVSKQSQFLKRLDLGLTTKLTFAAIFTR